MSAAPLAKPVRLHESPVAQDAEPAEAVRSECELNGALCDLREDRATGHFDREDARELAEIELDWLDEASESVEAQDGRALPGASAGELAKASHPVGVGVEHPADVDLAEDRVLEPERIVAEVR